MDDITQSITYKAVRNSKWVLLSSILSKVWQPVVTVILARLLMPKDFGLMALVMVVISFLGMFQDIGLSSALIQRKDNIEKAANIIFWTNIILGIIWFFITFFSSPYIALYFDNKQVSNILRMMGLSFLITPFKSVQLTLLSKELEFRRLFYFDLISSIFPGIISISLAYIGYGVWALVWGDLTSSIVHTLIIWLSVPWRPQWKYDLDISRELLSFGGFVSIEAILGWSITKIDNIFAGKFLGAGQLGIYNLGWNIGFWPAQNITSPLSRIFYPMFSMLQGDLDSLKKHYLKILELISIITFPLGVLIALTAHLFIPWLFGPKWIEAIPVIRIFSIIGIIASIVWVTPQVYKAIGRPDITPKFLIARSIISMPAYYLAAQKGVIFLCTVHLLLVLIFVPINIYISMRVLKITGKEILNRLALPISCTLLMGITIITFLILVKDISVIPDLLIMVMVVIFSMVVYLPFLYYRNRQRFFEIKKIVDQVIS